MSAGETVAVRSLTLATTGGRSLLTDSSITMTPGRILLLQGPSGAGKTTLMRSILGHLPDGVLRTRGDVTVHGRDVFALPPADLRRLRRQHLAFVGQDPGSCLNPTLRVRALLHEVAGRHSRIDYAEVLDRVQLPADFLNRRPGELSGGQQRRVALARALVRGADVLLIDEPLAGLDAPVRRQISALLRELAHSDGVAIAVTGHDTATLLATCDDVSTIGEPRRDTPPSGPPVRAAGPVAKAATGSAPALTAGAIHARHGRAEILRGVDIQVHAGTPVAVIGPSGAGKTTLARVLAGLHEHADGGLVLRGEKLPIRAAKRRLSDRRRIQYVPQNPLSTLNPRKTVHASIARPIQRRGDRRPADIARDVSRLLASMDLPESFQQRYPRQLSGGQRQRVSIARALAAEPDVLVCDEVTSALDAETADGIMRLLSQRTIERGLGLVVITHDVELARRYCTHVYVMSAGRVVEHGPVAEVFDAPRTAETADLLR